MANAEDRRIAGRSNLFAGLPNDLAEELFSQAHAKHYDRGETIFLQDEPAGQIFVVIEGWVKLFRIVQNGNEAVVGVFTEGQSFGEAVALKGDRYPVTAEAVTDTRLLQLSAHAVFELIQHHPKAFVTIMAAMYAHLHSLVEQIEQLKARTGAQRVAEFLLELCPTKEGSCTVRLPYDKVLIAGRLGMKPESLSRAFGRLRDYGVRMNNNNALLEDVQRLRAFAERDPALAWSANH